MTVRSRQSELVWTAIAALLIVAVLMVAVTSMGVTLGPELFARGVTHLQSSRASGPRLSHGTRVPVYAPAAESTGAFGALVEQAGTGSTLTASSTAVVRSSVMRC